MPELPSVQQVLASRPAPAGSKPAASTAALNTAPARAVALENAPAAVSAPPAKGQRSASVPALPKAQAESLLASLKGVSLHGSPAGPPAEPQRPQPVPAKTVAKPAVSSEGSHNQAGVPGPRGGPAGLPPASALHPTATATASAADATTGTAPAAEQAARDPRSDDILPGAAKKLFRLRLPGLR
jgi:hypothetical protein